MSKATFDGRSPVNMDGPAGTYLALGTAALAFVGIHVANQLAEAALVPASGVGAYYGFDGLALWVGVHLLTFGGFAVAGTFAYRRTTGSGFELTLPPEDPTRRMLGTVTGGVALSAVALVVLGPVAGTTASWEFVGRFGYTASVTGIGNSAPGGLVAAVVGLTRLLVVAPSVALLVHGLFQSSLEGPVGVAGGALLLLAVVLPLTPETVAGAPVGQLLYVAAGLLAVGTIGAYGYDRTGSALVPAAGYAAFLAAVTLFGALV